MKIYRNVPVLVDETKGGAGNTWSIVFRQGLFNMTSDSGIFRTARELASSGGAWNGRNWIDDSGEIWVPLYEGKMIHHYDHRWATFDENGTESRDVFDEEKRDPEYEPTPRYWVPQREVEARLAGLGWQRRWLVGWRDIARATDERTAIAAVVPLVGVGHNLPLFFVLADCAPRGSAALVGNFSAIVLDFLARLKVGGTHLTFFILKQLPFLPPTAYADADLEYIVPRVLELTYTSQALRPFAQDLEFDGPPFPWDPNRRAVLRAELDAYYAYLYGLTREELCYILDPADVYGENYPSETFRVLKNNEIRKYGEYRTRRLVLEAWDRLVAEGRISP